MIDNYVLNLLDSSLQIFYIINYRKIRIYILKIFSHIICYCFVHKIVLVITATIPITVCYLP